MIAEESQQRSFTIVFPVINCPRAQMTEVSSVMELLNKLHYQSIILKPRLSNCTSATGIRLATTTRKRTEGCKETNERAVLTGGIKYMTIVTTVQKISAYQMYLFFVT